MVAYANDAVISALATSVAKSVDTYIPTPKLHLYMEQICPALMTP
jgi:hypothetical protein